eukprot:scaffold70601_cov32-Tisochrysis_lutea.AAC.3
MSGRHVKVHVKRVHHLNLNHHEVLQRVGLIANEDEIVHVGNHHLLVLASKAESANAHQLKALTLDVSNSHVASHKVGRELQ